MRLTYHNFFIALAGITSAYILLILFYDFQAGGDAWKQGDWLINNYSLEIRRGPTGSFFIFVSDVLGLSPLTVVFITQFTMSLSLFTITIAAFYRSKNREAFVLLLMLPAFFFISWAADPLGSMRKELFSLLSIALLLGASISERRSALLAILAAIIFSIGTISHEINVFFWPAFALAIFLLWRSARIGKSTAISLALVTGVASLVSLIYALEYSQVADSAIVCQPLLDRGLRADICGGAIEWLEYDAGLGFGEVVKRAAAGNLFILFLSYLLLSIPLLHFNSCFAERSTLGLLFLLSAVPFLGLFFIGIDWGRWINLHISSFVLLALIMDHTNQLNRIKRPHRIILVPFAILALLWAPHHTGGIVGGGVTKEFLETGWNLLT